MPSQRTPDSRVLLRLTYSRIAMKLIITIVFGCCLWILISCNGGSTSVSDGRASVQWVVPGYGSYFVTRTTDSSSSGVFVHFDTTAKVNWREPKDGKPVVIGAIDGADSGFVAYEANGDFSLYGVHHPNAWDRYPTGGGSILDSSIIDTSNDTRFVDYHKISYAGIESISLPAGNFSAIKIHHSSWSVRTSNGKVVVDSNSGAPDNWFIPSVGWIGAETDRGNGWVNKSELYYYELH